MEFVGRPGSERSRSLSLSLATQCLFGWLSLGCGARSVRRIRKVALTLAQFATFLCAPRHRASLSLVTFLRSVSAMAAKPTTKLRCSSSVVSNEYTFELDRQRAATPRGGFLADRRPITLHLWKFVEL